MCEVTFFLPDIFFVINQGVGACICGCFYMHKVTVSQRCWCCLCRFSVFIPLQSVVLLMQVLSLIPLQSVVPSVAQQHHIIAFKANRQLLYLGDAEPAALQLLQKFRHSLTYILCIVVYLCVATAAAFHASVCNSLCEAAAAIYCKLLLLQVRGAELPYIFVTATHNSVAVILLMLFQFVLQLLILVALTTNVATADTSGIDNECCNC